MKAIEAYLSAIEVSENPEWEMHNIAKIYEERLNNSSMAKRYYLGAIEKGPTYFPPYFSLYRLLLKEGDLAHAKYYLLQAMKVYEGDEAEVEDMKHELQDLDRLIKEKLGGQALSPSEGIRLSSLPVPNVMGSGSTATGGTSGQRGAREVERQNTHQARLQRALALEKGGKFEKAIEALKSSMEVSDEPEKELNDIGRIYQENLNNPSKAKEFFLKSIEENPIFFDPYYRLQRVYRKEGDLEHALQYFVLGLGIYDGQGPEAEKMELELKDLKQQFMEGGGK